MIRSSLFVAALLSALTAFADPVSECLAMGLPMIVNSPIPGQEERNADFLLEQGVALRANDAVTLEYRVRLLLGDKKRLAGMSEKARALGKPHAARTVLDIVLG